MYIKIGKNITKYLLISCNYCTWNVVDVDVMITVYINKSKVKVQKPQVPYFTCEPPRRFTSKIKNLRLPVAGF